MAMAFASKPTTSRPGAVSQSVDVPSTFPPAPTLPDGPKPLPAAGPYRFAPADPTVAGHRRGGRSRVRSMRTQLLAPVLVAMLGLGVLGTVQTAEAVSNARDAERARVLATTATAT